MEFITSVGENPFLQYALLACLLAIVPCGVIGSFVVVRRTTYTAGAVSHSLLAGMGLALYLRRAHDLAWATPLAGAVLTAVVVALFVTAVTRGRRVRVDTALSAIWAVGMAIGLSFVAATPGYSEDLMGYLFGNILMIGPQDLWVMAVLNGVVALAVVLAYDRLVAISFHEELAALRGVHIGLYEAVFMLLTALTVALLTQIVGVVLVVALLTLPAASAGFLTRRLNRMILLAILFTLVAMVGGIWLSYGPEWPTGATIVELAGAIFVVSLLVSRAQRSWPWRRGRAKD